MSLELRRLAQLSATRIAELNAEMTAFYRNPPRDYYQIADESAHHYNPRELPFHCDLAGRVFRGATVLEMGCGTAHLCPQVELRGGNYTGIDHSEELVRQNSQRFPVARFLTIGEPLEQSFDIVASLYTIEHIADPVAYLGLMWQYCRPGGLIGIVCPEFVECSGLPPSVYYGRTSRRFREKLRTFDFADACLHLIDLKVGGALWKRRAAKSPPGAFWINLKPSVLHGAPYTIDADAVHFPRLKDLVWQLERQGATIVQTSAKMPNISPEILRFNCYVLARKPA